MITQNLFFSYVLVGSFFRLLVTFKKKSKDLISKKCPNFEFFGFTDNNDTTLFPFPYLNQMYSIYLSTATTAKFFLKKTAKKIFFASRRLFFYFFCSYAPPYFAASAFAIRRANEKKISPTHKTSQAHKTHSVCVMRSYQKCVRFDRTRVEAHAFLIGAHNTNGVCFVRLCRLVG